MIVAVAVNSDGKREVLGIAVGPSEAETFWTDFLRSLADRGLRGIKLVIADDHKGLRAAVRRVFNAGLQRCRVHWMRNALAHAPAKQRAAVAAMLKTIFAQETKAEAAAQWNVVADALREKQPKLGAMMDASREDVLAYMDFPKDHWPQMSSTNPLERLHKGAGHCHAQASIRRRRHLPKRRSNYPPRRRPDAGDQRRMGRRAPIHEPGNPGAPRPY